jgi:hypothetical protein
MKGKLLSIEEVYNLKTGDKVFIEKTKMLSPLYDCESKVYTVQGEKFENKTDKSFDTYINGYAVTEGFIKVYEWKDDVEMKSNQISKEELISSLKVGDLIYWDNKSEQAFNGWRLVIGDNRIISLNCKNFSYILGFNEIRDYQVNIKYVNVSEIPKFKLGDLSLFLQSFDESLIEKYIQSVIIKPEKSEKEIKLESLIEALSNQLEDAKQQLQEIKGC